MKYRTVQPASRASRPASENATTLRAKVSSSTQTRAQVSRINPVNNKVLAPAERSSAPRQAARRSIFSHLSESRHRLVTQNLHPRGRPGHKINPCNVLYHAKAPNILWLPRTNFLCSPGKRSTILTGVLCAYCVQGCLALCDR